MSWVLYLGKKNQNMYVSEKEQLFKNPRKLQRIRVRYSAVLFH